MARKIMGVTVGTTMNPKKIAGGATEEQLAQIAKNAEDISQLSSEIADLKENGGTVEWEDIQNKPFYDIEGVDISWDGNMDGLEKFVVEEGTWTVHYCLVSEKTPSNESFRQVMQTDTHVDNGEITEDTSGYPEEAWNSMIEEGFVTDDFIGGEGVAIVRVDNFELGGITIPKKGTYFKHAYRDENTYQYVSRIVTPNTTKSLDEKYIPDTICRKEYVDQLLGANLAEIASLVGGDA